MWTVKSLTWPTMCFSPWHQGHHEAAPTGRARIPRMRTTERPATQRPVLWGGSRPCHMLQPQLTSWDLGIYPLVNSHITMDEIWWNHHFEWENSRSFYGPWAMFNGYVTNDQRGTGLGMLVHQFWQEWRIHSANWRNFKRELKEGDDKQLKLEGYKQFLSKALFGSKATATVRCWPSYWVSQMISWKSGTRNWPGISGFYPACAVSSEHVWRSWSVTDQPGQLACNDDLLETGGPTWAMNIW